MPRRADPIPATVAKKVRALLKSLTKQIVAAQRREAPKLLAAHRKGREAFRRSLRRVWGGSIDALTHLVLRCWQLVEASTKERALDGVDQALLFLWARGCQTAFAICALLEDGFADDAHARWRTLHEVNVVAQLLRMNGEPLVERYFASVAVKNYKVSLDYERCAPALGYPAHDAAEMAQLKIKHDAAIEKFPGLGEGDWAWARPVLPEKNPKHRITFADIEKSVGLEKWRAHVGMAHHNVHAGAHGAFFRLGNPGGNGKRRIALAGPSLYGLADPGHACAISLQQLTLQLVSPRSADEARDPYPVAAAKALGPLVDLCGKMFGVADRRAKTREARMMRRRKPKLS